jgi:hypothetical protein
MLRWQRTLRLATVAASLCGRPAEPRLLATRLRALLPIRSRRLWRLVMRVLVLRPFVLPGRASRLPTRMQASQISAQLT